jgi:hypothetical protein
MDACVVLQVCRTLPWFKGSARMAAALVVVCLTGGLSRLQAQEEPAAAVQQSTAVHTQDGQTPAKHKAKEPYTGPTEALELPPTPLLDDEGKQRLDPDGKPMFNPPVWQLRDKKGHPVFDGEGKPVFQTAENLGYDEHGKKIKRKKVKEPKKTPVAIRSGVLTVDGWTGKARLNYDIADMKYMYVYAPGIGTTIVSLSQFPGATEQVNAFKEKTLHVTVEGHVIEVSSDKQLLGKRPAAAWVAVDRGFMLPSRFPVFGYGTTIRPPYAWPGSKQTMEAAGAVTPPPLPKDVQPKLLQPTACPASAPDQSCVAITQAEGK